jgi:hypothetical protein
VLQAGIRRLASTGRIDLRTEISYVLHQFRNVGGGYEPETTTIKVVERPPAISVPGYRPAAS